MSDLTYSAYLRLKELLSLQGHVEGEGVEHDEMLFVVIHQVYELWFRQLLHEIGFLQGHLEKGDASQALMTLRRVGSVLKTLVSQVDILETMTPLSFNAFRGRLQTSSGFQSVQFRLLETAMGHRHARMLEVPGFTDQDVQCLRVAMQKRSVFDSYVLFLVACGFEVPLEVLNRDVQQHVEPCEALQKVLVKMYRSHALAAQLTERLVDIDEGFQEWRYRHVKMVERTLGTKQGTGGSLGVEYLKRTLFQPFFPDLWAVRSEL